MNLPYIKLPSELQHYMKGLINVKSSDNECFRLCHVRHLNPQDKDPNGVKKSDKALVKALDYTTFQFPVKSNDYNKIEKQHNININVFGYENKLRYPIYVSKERFNDHLNLLLITNESNQHWVLIKDFNRSSYDQTKYANRKNFLCVVFNVFQQKKLETNLTQRKLYGYQWTTNNQDAIQR